MTLIEYSQECVDAAHGKWPGVEPGAKRKDRPRSITIFKNAFVENYLAKAHWVTPGLWFGPLMVYGIYRGLTDASIGAARTAGLFLAGLLIWTLVEYLLHRFLFHMHARNDDEKLRAFLIHGYHHDFPDDEMRLVMPPMVSWPLAVGWSLAYYLLFKQYWAPMIAGSAFGYVSYDWIHYYTHHGRPTGGVGKWLRKYHMKHHFKDGDAWYGVSSPLWDFVFGTYRSKKEAAGVEAHEG
jgi:sterol desaturase/sphingolipid hydroxylase (fatty acid hydroxylase superfamily)